MLHLFGYGYHLFCRIAVPSFYTVLICVRLPILFVTARFLWFAFTGWLRGLHCLCTAVLATHSTTLPRGSVYLPRLRLPRFLFAAFTVTFCAHIFPHVYTFTTRARLPLVTRLRFTVILPFAIRSTPPRLHYTHTAVYHRFADCTHCRLRITRYVTLLPFTPATFTHRTPTHAHTGCRVCRALRAHGYHNTCCLVGFGLLVPAIYVRTLPHTGYTFCSLLPACPVMLVAAPHIYRAAFTHLHYAVRLRYLPVTRFPVLGCVRSAFGSTHYTLVVATAVAGCTRLLHVLLRSTVGLQRTVLVTLVRSAVYTFAYRVTPATLPRAHTTFVVTYHLVHLTVIYHVLHLPYRWLRSRFGSPACGLRFAVYVCRLRFTTHMPLYRIHGYRDATPHVLHLDLRGCAALRTRLRTVTFTHCGYYDAVCGSYFMTHWFPTTRSHTLHVLRFVYGYAYTRLPRLRLPFTFGSLPHITLHGCAFAVVTATWFCGYARFYTHAGYTRSHAVCTRVWFTLRLRFATRILRAFLRSLRLYRLVGPLCTVGLRGCLQFYVTLPAFHHLHTYTFALPHLYIPLLHTTVTHGSGCRRYALPLGCVLHLRCGLCCPFPRFMVTAAVGSPDYLPTFYTVRLPARSSWFTVRIRLLYHAVVPTHPLPFCVCSSLPFCRLPFPVLPGYRIAVLRLYTHLPRAVYYVLRFTTVVVTGSVLVWFTCLPAQHVTHTRSRTTHTLRLPQFTTGSAVPGLPAAFLCLRLVTVPAPHATTPHCSLHAVLHYYVLYRSLVHAIPRLPVYFTLRGCRFLLRFYARTGFATHCRTVVAAHAVPTFAVGSHCGCVGFYTTAATHVYGCCRSHALVCAACGRFRLRTRHC